MICTSLAAPTPAEIFRDLSDVAQASDLVEIRLDTIEGIDPAAAEALFRTPCRIPRIATCRPHREGGEFGGSEPDRLAILQAAEAAGAEYIDVETFAWPNFPRKGKAKRILSYHNFIETPADLATQAARMAAMEPDIVKISTFAKDLRDSIRILAIPKSLKKPCIAIGMGDAGFLTRILTVAHGSVLTYACVSPEKASAPGQVPARTLRGMFRMDRLNRSTPLYGIFGNPVFHSLSPAVHNAALEATDLPGVYLPLFAERLDGIVGDLVKALPFQGFSVTIPHKEDALAEIDDADPIARRAGAVNTITLEKGRRKGTNTDAPAVVKVFQEALKRDRFDGLHALVIGAGGSARGAAAGLSEAGARVTIWNRNPERARKAASDIGCTAVRDLQAILSLDFGIIVQATPVGMNSGEGLPLDSKIFRAGQAVLDFVYTPPETEFLAEAKRRGAIPLSGLSVFLLQAALQFEAWTGKPAPMAIMEEAARRALRERGQPA